MTVRSYYLDDSGTLERDLQRDRMSEALSSSKGLLWVDICETTPADGALLAEVFRFHKLAIEDCVETLIHPPKIDEYDDHLFIVVHGINHAAGSSDVVETAELAMFIGSNYVVTNHNYPLYSVEEVVLQVEKNARPMRRGSDFLAYWLIDALVDNILPTLDRMSEVAEAVEDEALTTSHPEALQAIQRLKRSVRRVHRTIMPQRELLSRISRGEFQIIRQEHLVYFRDVYDHLVRTEDLNLNIRESADNAVTIYLSAIANRQNETMKVLSVIGAIFLPLTLLAGIYGMNFDYMPELHWQYSYFVVVGFMFSIIVGALILFWRRGWFRPRPFPPHLTKALSAERERLRVHLAQSVKRQKEVESAHEPLDSTRYPRQGA